MKKKFIAVLLLGAMIITSGCGTKNTSESADSNEKIIEDEASNEDILTEAEEDIDDSSVYNEDGTIYYDPTGEAASHVDISTLTGQFSTVPLYFMQDYVDDYGSSTIADEGNALTMMAMLYSYYSASYVTPPELLEKYADCLNEDGTINMTSAIERLSTDFSLNVSEETFDYVAACNYIEEDGSKILLHVDHPSKYGTASTWLLLCYTSDQGLICVRDADGDNIENYADNITLDDDSALLMGEDEPWYSAADIIEAAGSNSTMYVL